MSKELAPAATWRSTVTCPIDGDARDAASVEAGLQDNADRSEYLYGLAVTNGVVKMRTVDDETTMKALTGMSTNDLCAVNVNGDFEPRIYMFATSGTADDTYVHAADDSSGYWHMVSGPFAYEIWKMGIVTVDDEISPDVVGTYMDITGSTIWQDLTDGATPMSLTITALKAGDIIEVDASVQGSSDGSCTGAFHADVYFGSADHHVPGSMQYCSAGTTPNAMDCSGRYVMPSDQASVTLKLQGQTSAAGQHIYVGNSGLRLAYKVIRPR